MSQMFGGGLKGKARRVPDATQHEQNGQANEEKQEEAEVITKKQVA